ncbi:MAG TPA: DUF6679 family protein, partial [Phormidium sp.]
MKWLAKGEAIFRKSVAKHRLTNQALEEFPVQEKQYMLHRKIYQLCCDGREVCVFLRDQQRWIERARIIDIEGDLVTLRYETDEDDEVSS